MIKRKHTILAILFTVLVPLFISAQGKYGPTSMHMTLDYSTRPNSVDLNGPAFGVSWLMQNKFINTFDFAVGKSTYSDLADKNYNQNVTLRYQFYYFPNTNLGKVRAGVGLGMDNSLGPNKAMELNMLGRIRYPFYQSYFVEVIVPYNFYYTNFGGVNTNSDFSSFRTFKGIDISTKKFSTVRVGIGVSF